MVKKDMKKILPSAALAALIAAVAAYCIMLNVEKSMLSDYEKGIVLTAQCDIEEGIRITQENAKRYLSVTEIDKRLIPERAPGSMEEIWEQMTVHKVDKGAIITLSMLQDTEEIAKNMEEPVVAGIKADDLYQIVSGTLRGGDRIHICVTDKDSGKAFLGWENVFVQDAFDGSGTRIPGEDHVTAAQRINILLERAEIERFYSELSCGTLRIVKVEQ